MSPTRDEQRQAVLGCPKCRSLRLSLTEVYEEVSVHNAGYLVLVDGRIHPTDEGVSEPGEMLPKRSRITCQDCGHNWHPRRPIGETLEMR